MDEVISSDSEDTIIIPNSEDYPDIGDVLRKYSKDTFDTTPKINTSSKDSGKNIYDLSDFSDEDICSEPLEKRLKKTEDKRFCETYDRSIEAKRSWQDNFESNDFCENSNDMLDILNKLSQTESEDNTSREQLATDIKIIEVEGKLQSRFVNEEENDFLLEELHEKYLPNNENCKNICGYEGSKEDRASDTDKEVLTAVVKINEKANEGQANIEENIGEFLVNKLYDKYLPPKNNNEDNEYHSQESSKNNLGSKERNKAEKEIAKQERIRQKELKKQAAEQEKAEKNAQKFITKSIEPAECTKYLTVNIDNNVLSNDYCNIITTSLESGAYQYKFVPYTFRNLISWSRKVHTVENGTLKSTDQHEKVFVLLMDCKEFLKLIENNTLIGHVQSILSLLHVDRFILTVIGLQRYYTYLKNKQKDEFRSAVSDKPSKSQTKDYKLFQDFPQLNRMYVETTLIELQMFCKKCNFRPVENYEDLGAFIVHCSKAVAQIPYKTMSYEKYQNRKVFLPSINKKCVKVDKNGNGLGRLWNQMITMFPMANLEVAEAVTSVYPTVSSLIEAYKNCSTEEEKKLLLKDISIRRAAGPWSTVKKIGPVFSKRAYLYFCSEENVSLGK